MQGFNKYYPPDYDPKKHTSLNSYRGKHALGDRARKIDQGILITRFELPFNIWCDGCNNHIGMGVRYNAEKKKIGNYYSTPMYSFRCKCHLCDNWFTIETDPKNTRYVVTSGARQKLEDWDPAENGGFAVHDPDKAGPSDPLAALERTAQAEAHLNAVQKPRLEELQNLSDHYNSDPFAFSSRVRKHFRAEKKVDRARKNADDAVRNKYALPAELTLVADDHTMKEEAKQAFSQERLDHLADEDAKQREINAEIGLTNRSNGSLSSNFMGRSPPISRSSTIGAAGASFSLRKRLLQSKARNSDLFLRREQVKAPAASDLGIILKR